MAKSSIMQAFILFCLFALSQSAENTYTTGLPKLAKDLGIDEGLAQASSSIYFYGFATGIFVLGSLSDKIGRRKVILFGLSLFFLSNILIFFVHSIYLLYALRFIGAFGASVGSSCAQAVARDSYTGKELSRLYSLLGTGLAVVPSLSSFIAGNIIKHVSWRYLFAYLASIVLMIFLLCLFKLKETLKPEIKVQYFSFYYIFKTIIRDKRVLCFGTMIGCYNGIMYSFYIEAPFLFMHRLSVDPAHYGILILMLGIAAALGGITGRFMQGRIDHSKTIILFGLTLSLLSCSSLVFLAFALSANYLATNFAIYSIILAMMGQSFSYTIVMPLALRHALEDYGKVNGTAGSIFGMFYYVIVASINFMTTRLHSDNIISVSLFFLCVSSVTFLCFSIAIKIKRSKSRPFKL